MGGEVNPQRLVHSVQSCRRTSRGAAHMKKRQDRLLRRGSGARVRREDRKGWRFTRRISTSTHRQKRNFFVPGKPSELQAGVNSRTARERVGGGHTGEVSAACSPRADVVH